MKKTAMITTRVKESTRDALARIAEKEHRSISQQVALILDEHLSIHRDPSEKTGQIEPKESCAHGQQSAPSAP